MLSLPFRVLFGSDGDYLPWAIDGWSGDPDDRTHTWIDGYIAKLKLPLDLPVNGRLLIADVIPSDMCEQDLFLFVNGAFSSFWNIKHATEVTTVIESNNFKVGDNVFTFVTPRALRPSELIRAGDERLLGCAFRSLSLLDL